MERSSVKFSNVKKALKSLYENRKIVRCKYENKMAKITTETGKEYEITIGKQRKHTFLIVYQPDTNIEKKYYGDLDEDDIRNDIEELISSEQLSDLEESDSD